MPALPRNLAADRAFLESVRIQNSIFAESCLSPAKPLVRAVDPCTLFRVNASVSFEEFEGAKESLIRLEAHDPFTLKNAIKPEPPLPSEVEAAKKIIEIKGVLATTAAKELQLAELSANKLAGLRSVELKDLLVKLNERFPTELLKELTNGAALVISPNPAVNAVTPGQLHQAIERKWEQRVRPTVAVSTGQYVSAIQLLTFGLDVVSSWAKMLIQLRDIHMMVEDTWAAMRAGPLCAMILDVLKSKGTPLSGLLDAVGEVWHVDFVKEDHRTVTDLLEALDSYVVNEALVLVQLAAAAVPKDTPKVVAKKAGVPSPPRSALRVDELDTYDKVGRGQCRNFKATGACPFGTGCRFSHEV